MGWVRDVLLRVLEGAEVGHVLAALPLLRAVLIRPPANTGNHEKLPRNRLEMNLPLPISHYHT